MPPRPEPRQGERRIYVCEVHGETLNVVAMGGEGTPPWCVECRKPVQIKTLVPSDVVIAAIFDALSAMDPMTANRWREESSYKRLREMLP